MIQAMSEIVSPPAAMLNLNVNKSFVYFLQHGRHDEYRIGFTGPDDGNFDRLRTHERNGWYGKAKAIVPGTYEDEQRTHRLLESFLIRHSVYRADPPLVEYIEALLLLGRAAPDETEAKTWSALPFIHWCFGASSLCHVDPNGQLNLFRAAPQRERLQYAHSQAILQTRGDEWNTPGELVNPARLVMGGIDLDPASNPYANRTVLASVFYTKPMDGLNRALPWSGRVWLNPPYGIGPQSARPFIERLVEEFDAGRVTEAITCLNLNSMSSEWFRPLHDHATAHAIMYGRPSFIPPTGVSDSSPTKGTVLSYLGQKVDAFADAYGQMSKVLVAHNEGR